MQLNAWDNSWPFRATCPCDRHFADYLRERRIGGKTLFHFGSGEHHLLGIDNLRKTRARRNEILAVTASRGEYRAYVDLICDYAELALHYKVLFADVYTLTPGLLPPFDLVSLFHLCEFYDPARSRYAPLDDAGLIELFLGRLNPEGRLLFYTGSTAFPRARPILDGFLDRGWIEEIETYKTLLVCGAGASYPRNDSACVLLPSQNGARRARPKRPSIGQETNRRR
jgi:hypothetical protein